MVLLPRGALMSASTAGGNDPAARYTANED